MSSTLKKIVVFRYKDQTLNYAYAPCIGEVNSQLRVETVDGKPGEVDTGIVDVTIQDLWQAARHLDCITLELKGPARKHPEPPLKSILQLKFGKQAQWVYVLRTEAPPTRAALYKAWIDLYAFPFGLERQCIVTRVHQEEPQCLYTDEDVFASWGVPSTNMVTYELVKPPTRTTSEQTGDPEPDSTATLVSSLAELKQRLDTEVSRRTRSDENTDDRFSQLGRDMLRMSRQLDLLLAEYPGSERRRTVNDAAG